MIDDGASPRASFAETYAAALTAYLAGGGEDALSTAYELGREALVDGLGVIDVAGVHAQTIAAVPGAARAAAAVFFAEAVTPFEMALRGYREANEQLRVLNADLAARNAELVRAREAAEHAVRELDAFTAAVSHDLRAPARRVKSFATILAEDHGPELSIEAKDTLTRIRRAGDHMTQLVEDMLRLSRVATSELVIERCNVTTMARATLASLADADAQRRVDVEVEDGLFVYADARLLQIVLDNLLGNAWKFTSKTDAPRIEVRASGDAIAIKDNGAGFDPAALSKLFLPFQRLHSEAVFEGTGIGLATVARVVRRHGGHVSAQGDPGHGATFTFTMAPHA